MRSCVFWVVPSSLAKLAMFQRGTGERVDGTKRWVSLCILLWSTYFVCTPYKCSVVRRCEEQ